MSVYLFPILYVLSIYSIVFSVALGWKMPKILMYIPLLFGISNFLAAFLLNKEKNDKKFAKMQVRLWDCKMVDGVIKFIKPNECSIIKDIRDMEIKQFIPNTNFRYVSDETII